MVKKSNQFIIFLSVAFLLCGCQSIPDLLSNPFYVDVATRQAVARYIEAGKTIEDQNRRSAQVVTTVNKILVYLDGYPTAQIPDLITVIESNISWENLELSDRVLVKDILGLLRANLETKLHRGLLDDDQVIRIRKLLNTIIFAAGVI